MTDWISTKGYFMLGLEVNEMSEADYIIAESKGEEPEEFGEPIYRYSAIRFDRREVTYFYDHLFIDDHTVIRFKSGDMAVIKMKFNVAALLIQDKEG